MENAKDQLLNNGVISDKTVKDFCDLFECDKDFAIKFLNDNQKLTHKDNLED